jgi:hypothetical protein
MLFSVARVGWLAVAQATCRAILRLKGYTQFNHLSISKQLFLNVISLTKPFGDLGRFETPGETWTPACRHTQIACPEHRRPGHPGKLAAALASISFAAAPHNPPETPFCLHCSMKPASS